MVAVCRDTQRRLLGDALQLCERLRYGIDFFALRFARLWSLASVGRRYIENVLANVQLEVCPRIDGLRTRRSLVSRESHASVISAKRRVLRLLSPGCRAPRVSCTGRLRLVLASSAKGTMALEKPTLFLLSLPIFIGGLGKWCCRLAWRRGTTGWLDARERIWVGDVTVRVSARGSTRAAHRIPRSSNATELRHAIQWIVVVGNLVLLVLAVGLLLSLDQSRVRLWPSSRLVGLGLGSLRRRLGRRGSKVLQLDGRGVFQAHFTGEGIVWVVVRLKNGWLGRRASKGRVHRSLELCHGVLAFVRCLRCSIDVASAEVDELRRIRYLLSGAILADEIRNVFLDVAVLKRESNLLTRLDLPSVPEGRRQRLLTASSLTHTVEAMLAKVHKLLFM